MKTKITIALITMSLVIAVTGCSSKKKSSTTKDSDKTAVANEWVPFLPSDYVTLGEYIGLEYSLPTDIEEVVDQQIDNLLSNSATTAEVTDRTDVQSGDIVNIDYVGYVDGATFDGGTATGQNLTIGSNSYIDGFESGLIGANVGSTVTLNLTFPDPYSTNPDLSGKAVQFDVTINSISTSKTPELTDDFIASNTSKSTIEEYKQFIREDYVDYVKKTAIYQQISTNCTVNNYPTKELSNRVDELKTNYESQITMLGYTDISAYLSAVGSDEATFNSQLEEEAKQYLNQDIIIAAIADKENIQLTDDDYNDFVNVKYAEAGFESADALIAQYGEYELKLIALSEKVLDYLVEQGTEVAADSSTTEATTEEQ